MRPDWACYTARRILRLVLPTASDGRWRGGAVKAAVMACYAARVRYSNKLGRCTIAYCVGEQEDEKSVSCGSLFWYCYCSHCLKHSSLSRIRSFCRTEKLLVARAYSASFGNLPKTKRVWRSRKQCQESSRFQGKYWLFVIIHQAKVGMGKLSSKGSGHRTEGSSSLALRVQGGILPGTIRPIFIVVFGKSFLFLMISSGQSQRQIFGFSPHLRSRPPL